MGALWLRLRVGNMRTSIRLGEDGLHYVPPPSAFAPVKVNRVILVSRGCAAAITVNTKNADNPVTISRQTLGQHRQIRVAARVF